MSGRPTTSTARTYPPQYVWTRMQAQRRFTVEDLANDQVPASTLQGYVSAWEADGHLVRVATRRTGAIIYECRLVSPTPPPVRQPQTGKVRSVRDAAAKAMWNAARGLRAFSLVDLAAHGTTPDLPIGPAEARLFVNLLLRGGYLRVTEKAGPGGRLARYRLLRDTGPEAPCERRVRVVYDPNRQEYFHVPEAGR